MNMGFLKFFNTIFEGYNPFTVIQNIGYIPHVVQYILSYTQ